MYSCFCFCFCFNLASCCHSQSSEQHCGGFALLSICFQKESPALRTQPARKGPLKTGRLLHDSEPDRIPASTGGNANTREARAHATAASNFSSQSHITAHRPSLSIMTQGEHSSRGGSVNPFASDDDDIRSTISAEDIACYVPSSPEPFGGEAIGSPSSEFHEQQPMSWSSAQARSEISVRVQPPTRAPTGDLTSLTYDSFNLGPRRRTTEVRSSVSSTESIPVYTIPATGSDPLENPLFPHHVNVIASLTLDTETQTTTIENFDWTQCEQRTEARRHDNYEKLDPRGQLKAAFEEPIHQTRYLRHGTCSIKRLAGDHQRDLHIASIRNIDELRQKAVLGICLFISNNPYMGFTLIIHWNYGLAYTKPLPAEGEANLDGERYGPGTDFVTMIRREMKHKVKSNFQNKDFIPRQDLNVFLSKDVIHNVVNSQNALCKGLDKKDEFEKIIILQASKIFALFVFEDLELTLLQHLIDPNGHALGDTRRPQVSDACEKARHCTKDNLTLIVAKLPIFFAHRIDRDYLEHTISETDILPIYDAKHEREGPHLLGDGISGKVYEVNIDLAHNEPLGDPDSSFALKAFKNSQDFYDEMFMMKGLVRYPHPHIVPHVTAWTIGDSGKHYILFDRADCNLRRFLNEFKFDQPNQSGSITIWFLQQLRGLADAIARVHKLSLPFETPKRRHLIGRHNDIKPENILVFCEDKERLFPSLRVADFGQGISQYSDRSKSVSGKPRGTASYWAPDPEYKDNKRVSRPFDMWALGCVYLELLLWFFGFYQDPTTNGFATERQEVPISDSNPYAHREKDDRFWWKNKDKRNKNNHCLIELKPGVVKVLEELQKKHCQGMRPFLEVIQNIRRMFKIHHKKRLSAERLVKSMDFAISQAEKELRDDANYYINRLARNLSGLDTGPPTPSCHLTSSLPSETRSPNVSASASSDHVNEVHII